MEMNNLKNHNMTVGRSMKEPITITTTDNKKVRESWEYFTSHENHHSGDLISGYLWNPRSYTCSFCKREFRSAQALGGHMNVHRRDRARLRQYSPPNTNPTPNPFINLNLNPNPNPNKYNNCSFSSQTSSPSANFSQITTTLPLIGAKNWATESSPHHCYKGDQDLEKIKYSKALFGEGKFESFGEEIDYGISKSGHQVRLDLEIGLITGKKEAMDLDLELRLGR